MRSSSSHLPPPARRGAERLPSTHGVAAVGDVAHCARQPEAAVGHLQPHRDLLGVDRFHGSVERSQKPLCEAPAVESVLPHLYTTTTAPSPTLPTSAGLTRWSSARVILGRPRRRCGQSTAPSVRRQRLFQQALRVGKRSTPRPTSTAAPPGQRRARPVPGGRDGLRVLVVGRRRWPPAVATVAPAPRSRVAVVHRGNAERLAQEYAARSPMSALDRAGHHRHPVFPPAPPEGSCHLQRPPLVSGAAGDHRPRCPRRRPPESRPARGHPDGLASSRATCGQ
jgi:hypothetical protein